MEMQEAFDKVVAHLFEQKERSMAKFSPHEPPNCAYRGEHGLKCAIGTLISDEEYSRDMESKSVTELLSRFPSLAFANINHGFLSQLQQVHDGSFDWDDPDQLKLDMTKVRTKLQAAAANWNLNLPEVLR